MISEEMENGMNAQRVSLTPNEATIIGQRALLERISGRPGIWSHLKDRLRPVNQSAKSPSIRLNKASVEA